MLTSAARAKTLKSRGIYLDLVVHDEQIRKHQTPYTPAVSLLYALHEQVGRIIASGGIEQRWARHEAMRKTTEAWATANGLSVSDRGRLRPEIHQAWLEANRA